MKITATVELRSMLTFDMQPGQDTSIDALTKLARNRALELARELKFATPAEGVREPRNIVQAVISLLVNVDAEAGQ